jgi:hypothetical protein
LVNKKIVATPIHVDGEGSYLKCIEKELDEKII